MKLDCWQFHFTCAWMGLRYHIPNGFSKGGNSHRGLLCIHLPSRVLGGFGLVCNIFPWFMFREFFRGCLGLFYKDLFPVVMGKCYLPLPPLTSSLVHVKDSRKKEFNSANSTYSFLVTIFAKILALDMGHVS